MNKSMVSAFCLAGLLVVSPVLAGDGMIILKCFDNDEGASVFVNDLEVGTCPGMVPIPAGDHDLSVRKSDGAEHERVFNKKFRIFADALLPVEVTLSAPQLTAQARKKREIAEAQKQLRAAEGGNVDAMNAVARYYADGTGVERDPALAQQWRDRATATTKAQREQAEADRTRSLQRTAQSGDIGAMRQLADRLDQGLGTPRDPQAASDWRNKAEIAVTENLRAQAERGDIDAMGKVADRYEAGQGASRDTDKARQWRDKRTATIKERERQAETARKRREIEAVVAQKKNELDQIDMFEGTKAVATEAFDGKSRDGSRNDNLSSRSTLTTILPVGFVEELVLTVPFRASSYFSKKSELDSAEQELGRLSRLGNPNALLARVARWRHAEQTIALK